MFDELIDARQISGRQKVIFALCMVILIIDGLDFQLLAFASPVLLVQWKITKAQLAPALASALIGMALGAAVGGAAGDRFGGRRTLIVVVTAFGITTLATAVVANVSQLIALRFVSGFGFGIAVPTAMALVSEWCPRKRRGQLIVLMATGSMIGGTLGGLLAAWLVPAFGWRSIFIASGGLTLASAALCVVFLPESLSFLAGSGRQKEAFAWLNRVSGPAAVTMPAPGDMDAVQGAVPEAGARLFSRQNLRVNLGLWGGFFALSYAAFGYISWTPVVLVNAGFSLQNAIRGTSIYTLFAVIGVLACAISLRRLGSRLLLVLSIIATVAVAAAFPDLLAAGQSTSGAVDIAMVIAGFGGGLAQATVYALAAMAYPASYRATALGLCVGISRAGGIVSVASGGIQLEMSGSNGSVFFGALACLLIAGLIALSIVDRHISTAAIGREASAQ